MYEIAGDTLKTTNLIPGGMCPGHYDARPVDVEAVANSSLFIIHNWQQDKANIQDLITAADNPHLNVSVIDILDVPMLPAYQIELVKHILDILGNAYPDNVNFYTSNLERREQRIASKETELQNRLRQANIDGIKVLCSNMQADFIKWVGFDVIATYGRPEELSVRQVEQLVTLAKSEGVTLVIDNLQSGGTTASQNLAHDIGVAHVTITNFPGGFDNTETWNKAVDKNIDLLLESVFKSE
jgi:zinc transport system substrate-binding protein